MTPEVRRVAGPDVLLSYVWKEMLASRACRDRADARRISTSSISNKALDAATLGRAATVVRLRCYVADRADLKASGLK